MAGISLRCTNEEKEKIKQAADSQGIDMSKYILRVCNESSLPDCKKGNGIRPDTICNLHTFINKLEAKELSKKEFIKKARKELDRWYE